MKLYSSITALCLILVMGVGITGIASGEQTGSREATVTRPADSADVAGIHATADPEFPAASIGAGNTANVTVDPNKRYYDTDQLARGLLYDLVPLSPYFVEAQETYGIDAVFLAAVSAYESGWGRYQFRTNNIFGFEHCNFHSLEECIYYASSWLLEQYLTPGGLYYEGVGVDEINTHYNGSPDWAENVKLIMKQITDRIEEGSAKQCTE